ncbi:Serine/threonine-protein kinase PSK2 [Leucoagaricus sp. SymC.cos]|nr:Serine/threonine-protein kinase PSK2 [Leucoagaricus sp. SymC.cos]
MTARQRLSRREVAVKFIIKDKVPEHAWMDDELLGRLPTEVVLLQKIDHENVVKFLDFFEDELYYYLVQELHGCPWQKSEEDTQKTDSTLASTPSLSPSLSQRSLSERSTDSLEPKTPPPTESCPLSADKQAGNSDGSKPVNLIGYCRPGITRRSSHDLFECIEQSDEKRLSESQARQVFAQVVDVVCYLDSLGIAHRDIKDENLVIDENLKVKLIDFGSACICDPSKPRPFHTQFYGTAAYASSEILLRKRYQAGPAEIWTLGVLLSYLLTGNSPFPSPRAAVEGRIVISEPPGVHLPQEAVNLMRRCLDPNPFTRIKIQKVKEHPWLTSS